MDADVRLREVGTATPMFTDLAGSTASALTTSGDAVDRATSSKRAKTDATDRLEMLPITGDDRESVLDRRCGDQCIGKPDSELTGDTSTTLGNSTIHRELAERGKKPNGEVSSSVAGDELRPRDHGVMHPMTSRSQLDRAAKMVNEDISVDQDVSHDASRHGKERTRPEPLRRCS